MHTTPIGSHLAFPRLERDDGPGGQLLAQAPMRQVSWVSVVALTAVVGLCPLSACEHDTETRLTPHASLNRLTTDPDFVDLSTIPGVAIDLKYASRDNFMGENLYGDFRTALLHRIAAGQLEVSSMVLQALKPGWKLLVFDGLRPRAVQRQFWNRVKGTPQQEYVADPDTGSIHNFGFAVDVSLMDEGGREVDMGTSFDDFSPLSEPRREDEFLKAGKLTPEQVDNRRILRRVMSEAGFIQYPIEWWHFDALPADIVRKNYPIVE